MTLDQILGQVVPVSILRRGLETKTLGHAYLFSGDEGLGKETTARLVAHELRKQGGPLSELHVLAGDGSIGVDEIRSLRQRAANAPSGYSIWLILGAERMTVQASNAFLKILEEPPLGMFFFLTTTQIYSLLPTIISRCQHLPFRRIAEVDIAKWLAEKTGSNCDDTRVRSIARLAQGSLGRAWEYWQGTVLEARAEVIAKLIRVPHLSYPEVLGMSQAWPEDRLQINHDLQLILEWHRDLLTVQNKLDLPLYNPGYERELQELSVYYSDHDLFAIIEQITDMGQAIAGNARIRFCIGYLLLLMKKGALT